MNSSCVNNGNKNLSEPEQYPLEAKYLLVGLIFVDAPNRGYGTGRRIVSGFGHKESRRCKIDAQELGE